MTQYVPLNIILNNIPKSVRDYSGDDRLLYFALEAYRGLNLKDKKESKWTILTVKNFQTEIPLEISSINKAFKTEKKLLDNLCNSDDSLKFCTDKLTRCADCDLPIISYIGNKNNIINKSYLDCGTCTDSFSVDQNRLATFSFKEGYVLMSYNSEILEDDMYMIIDNSSIIQGLSTYAMAYSWLERISDGETNATTMYQTLLNQSEILLKRGKSSIKLSNINVDTVSEITGDLQRNIRFVKGWKTI